MAPVGTSSSSARLVGDRIFDRSHSGAATASEENQWVTFRAAGRPGVERDGELGRLDVAAARIEDTPLGTNVGDCAGTHMQGSARSPRGTPEMRWTEMARRRRGGAE